MFVVEDVFFYFRVFLKTRCDFAVTYRDREETVGKAGKKHSWLVFDFTELLQFFRAGYRHFY